MRAKARRKWRKWTTNVAFGVFLWVVVIGFLPVATLVPATIELPLSDMGGMAMDAQGRIYISARAFKRIQIYSTTGKYITSIYAENVYFTEQFGVDARGCIYTGLTSGDTLRVYNHKGEVVRTVAEYEPTAFRHYELSGGAAVSKSGGVYEVGEQSWWYPTIVKVEADGDRELVISQPWYLWIHKTPMPLPIFALCAFIVLVINEGKRGFESTWSELGATGDSLGK